MSSARWWTAVANVLAMDDGTFHAEIVVTDPAGQVSRLVTDPYPTAEEAQRIGLDAIDIIKQSYPNHVELDVPHPN